MKQLQYFSPLQSVVYLLNFPVTKHPGNLGVVENF